MFRYHTTVATTLALALIAGVTAASPAAAATLTTIAHLNSLGTDALTLGLDGQLYGASGSGGAKNDGYFFKVSTAGVVTTLASLDPTVNGLGPTGGVVFDTAGNIFDTASTKFGVGAQATVLKLTTAGVLSRVATLGTNTYPYNGLTIDGSNNMYGVSPFGGSGYGTVFKVAPDGTATTLATFNQANGAYPMAQLTLDVAGNIYGTTENGGTGIDQYSNGRGGIFKISSTGVFSTLVQFDGTNSASPRGKLAIDGNGNLFGTTQGGTIFEVSSAGVFTTIAKFSGISGLGHAPAGGLLIDAAGNLFGTTVNGGDTLFGQDTGSGTVFELTAGGVLKTIATFDGSNGSNPYAGLTADAAGNLYGTTSAGTIFKLGGTGFVTPTVGGVPEPTSWALLLTGFGVVGAAARRRRTIVAA